MVPIDLPAMVLQPAPQLPTDNAVASPRQGSDVDDDEFVDASGEGFGIVSGISSPCKSTPSRSPSRSMASPFPPFGRVNACRECDANAHIAVLNKSADDALRTPVSVSGGLIVAPRSNSGIFSSKLVADTVQTEEMSYNGCDASTIDVGERIVIVNCLWERRLLMFV